MLGKHLRCDDKKETSSSPTKLARTSAIAPFSLWCDTPQELPSGFVDAKGGIAIILLTEESDESKWFIIPYEVFHQDLLDIARFYHVSKYCPTDMLSHFASIKNLWQSDEDCKLCKNLEDASESEEESEESEDESDSEGSSSEESSSEASSTERSPTKGSNTEGSPTEGSNTEGSNQISIDLLSSTQSNRCKSSTESKEPVKQAVRKNYYCQPCGGEVDGIRELLFDDKWEKYMLTRDVANVRIMNAMFVYCMNY